MHVGTLYGCTRVHVCGSKYHTITQVLDTPTTLTLALSRARLYGLVHSTTLSFPFLYTLGNNNKAGFISGFRSRGGTCEVPKLKEGRAYKYKLRNLDVLKILGGAKAPLAPPPPEINPVR